MPNVPSQWVLSNQVANNNAIVAIPACLPQIQHVIDRIVALAINNAVPVGVQQGTVTVVDTTAVVTLLTFNLATATQAVGEVDRDGFDYDIPVQFIAEHAAAVRFNFNPNVSQLIVWGHSF